MAAMTSAAADAELRKARFSEKYELGELLGCGTYAHVYKCKSRASGEVYACKVVHKSSLKFVARETHLEREVRLVQALSGQHEGVLQVLDVFESDRMVHIVTELCRGRELFQLLQRHDCLPEPAAKLVFKQLVSAVVFCHSRGIVHRDIKPENVLFDIPPDDLYQMTPTNKVVPPVRAKLADFGLAFQLAPGQKTFGYVGSEFYVAPEIVKGELYGVEVDVWSLGVVLCTMLTCKMPFSGRFSGDTEGLEKAIKRGKVNWDLAHWKGVSADAKRLIKRMLDVNPRTRITAAEILSDTWLSGIGSFYWGADSESLAHSQLATSARPAFLPCTPPRRFRRISALKELLSELSPAVRRHTDSTSSRAMHSGSVEARSIQDSDAPGGERTERSGLTDGVQNIMETESLGKWGDGARANAVSAHAIDEEAGSLVEGAGTWSNGACANELVIMQGACTAADGAGQDIAGDSDLPNPWSTLNLHPVNCC